MAVTQGRFFMTNQTNLKTKKNEQMPLSTELKRLDERLSELADADLQMLHGEERTGAAFDNAFDNSFDNSA